MQLSHAILDEWIEGVIEDKKLEQAESIINFYAQIDNSYKAFLGGGYGEPTINIYYVCDQTRGAPATRSVEVDFDNDWEEQRERWENIDEDFIGWCHE